MRPIIIALLALLGVLLIVFLIVRASGPISLVTSPTPTPSQMPTPTPTITPSYAMTATVTVSPITPAPTSTTGITDALSHNNSLGLFTKAINDTGLNGILNSGDPYTVFALDNNNMQSILNSAGSNTNILNDKLKMQIVYGILDSNQIKNRMTSLSGQDISLGNANVDGTIPVNNGIIYIVSSPVTPQ